MVLAHIATPTNNREGEGFTEYIKMRQYSFPLCRFRHMSKTIIFLENYLANDYKGKGKVVQFVNMAAMFVDWGGCHIIQL